LEENIAFFESRRIVKTDRKPWTLDACLNWSGIPIILPDNSELHSVCHSNFIVFMAPEVTQIFSDPFWDLLPSYQMLNELSRHKLPIIDSLVQM
jgi:hypothetical protein